MNPQQQEAVTYNDGPLLIIAGAGTGKTTTVVEKINYLIQNNLAKPEEILALTFTEKAAQEMEQRVDERLPYGYTQTWISTFHSFADTVLRTDIAHVGISSGYRLMTEAETISFLRERLFMFNLKYFRPLGNPNKFLDAILQHISRLRDEDITCEEYARWVASESEQIEPEEQEKRRELAHVYSTYQELKIKEGVFDYGDLIYYLLHLFRKRPNIANEYRTSFKYVLVDEFQDTNIAQYNLVKMLCPADSNPKLTVVGDDSQAIYKFRGASVSNILTFMKDFETAKHISLLTNYRSSQPILDAAYRMIKHNDPDTLEAQLGISKKLVAGREADEKKSPKDCVDFTVTNRVEEEAEHVASLIKTHAKDREYKDFAILVRANSHADPFINALTRSGIPFHFHGPGSLYKQPEVKDLIAYLTVLANAEDSISLYRVLCMQIFNLHAQDIAYLLAFSKKTATPLMRAVEIIVFLLENPISTPESEIYRTHLPFLREDTKAKLKRLSTHFQNAFKNVKKLTAGQLLYNFLEDSGYLQVLGTVTSERDERRTMLISKFFDKLKAYESTHEDASVHAVVDYITLSMELGESPATADTDEPEYNAVNILTVHGSKGLEFPVVFLVNLSSERFPTRARREVIPIPAELIKEVLPQGDYHLEEERRLFYVAMTRAKDLLFLSAARFYGEGKRLRKVSPFVYEALGETAVEKQLNIKTEEKQQLSIFDFKPTPEPEVIKQQIKRSLFVSYSQLDTYERCSLRYKYQYVLKIPAPANAAASFGTSVHNALQVFYQMYKADDTVGLEQLIEQLHKMWIPLGYASQAHERRMKKEGEEMLTKFYTEHHKPGIVIVDLEKLFRIKISDQVYVSGKIDRVDQLEDGSIEIIDYKTGAKPNEKELKDNIQLATYLMAAGEKSLYNKPAAQVVLTFYYLQDNAKISMKKSDEDILKTKERILQSTAQMATGEYKPTVGIHCSFCPFKMICEAWQ